MVKPRENGIANEFKGGLIPGLTKDPAGTGNRQKDGKTASQSDSPARKKVTLYLDDPKHTNLMDDLLTQLKRFGLPRDNSMLVRALLEMAAPALTDPAQLEELARACEQTKPNR